MASLKTVKKILGLSGQDFLTGGSSDESIYGLAGNDTLRGNGGNDALYGGVGIDTAEFSGKFADYNFANPTGGLQVTHARGTKADGSDFVASDVERLKFSDITIDLTINHNPVAINDTNGSDTVKEKGGLANSKAGDATATGNVLSNDTDIEVTLGRQTLSVTNPGTYTGKFGALTLNANGVWTYKLNDNDTDTQRLKQGQTATDAFSYTVSDGKGGTAVGKVTISIQGANDTPIAVADTNGSDSVQEAGGVGNTTVGDPSAAGNVLSNDTDVDAGDTKTVTTTGVFVGTYGNLTLTANGTWQYVLRNADTATQRLTQAQVAADVFSYTIKDTVGATSTAQLTINIAGSNDAPVVTSSSSAAAGTVTEAGHLGNGTVVPGTNTITGQLTSSDVDAGATAQWSIAGVSGYGSIAIDSATGIWTYTLDNTRPSTQGLYEGQTVSETFTATVKDNFGAIAAQDITVTINGTNDRPTVSAVTGTAIEDGASVTITLAGDDVDSDNGPADLTYAILPLSEGIGSATIAGNQLIYSPGAAFQDLAEGEYRDIVITYSATDAHNAVSTTSTVTVRVTGTNDGPTVSAHGDGAVTEDDSVPTLTETGTITFDDLDLSDEHTVANGIAAGANTLGGELTASVTTPATGAGSGSVTWNYSVANSATQYLGAGDTATETFTVTIDDGKGGQVAQDISVIVNGTNDEVIITSGVQTGAVIEDDAAANAATGSIAFSDVDLSDGHTAWFAQSNATALGTFALQPVSEAPNAATGSVGWTYTLNDTAAQHLGEGVDVYETFTVSITDNKGSTKTETVTIKITGTNDAPVLSDTTDPAAIAELATAMAQDIGPVSGSFNVFDADIGDTLTPSLSSGPVVALKGSLYALPAGASSLIDPSAFSLTGTTSNGATTSIGYTYDPGVADLDFLTVNDTLTIAYAVQVSDGTGNSGTQNVTITITGTNDAPVAAADTASAAENGVQILIDVLANDTDIDRDDDSSTLKVISAVAASGALVTFTGAPGAGIAYDPNSTTAFEHLRAGQQTTDAITYTIEDSHGAQSTSTVTVTVTGTNDAAVIGNPPSHIVTEDVAVDSSGYLVADGTGGYIPISDIDDGETSFIPANIAIPGVDRGLSLFANGHYIYYVKNADIQGYDDGETFTDQFTIQSVDGTTKTIEFTFYGANDAPVVAPRNVTITENDTVSLNLLAGASDVDDEALSIVGVPGSITSTSGTRTLTAGVDYTVSAAGTSFNLTTTGRDKFNSLGDGVSDSFVVNFGVSDGTVTTPGTWTVTVDGRNDAPVANDDAIGSLVYTYLGFYAVYDGPHWTTNPETYSGVEAAALLFGGSPTQYAISTNSSVDPATITHTAWYDGWGEHGGMQFADDYELDTGDPGYATPGGSATARSAYVRDALSNTSVYRNHVWREANTGAITNEDASVSIAAASLLANDTDVDTGDTLSVTAVSALSIRGASVAISGTDIIYNPTGSSILQALDDGETLTDTFTYTISDGKGGSDTATVTLSVAGRNDAPVVAARSTTINENATVSLNLLAGATDVDGETLSIVSVPGSITSTSGTRTLTQGVDYTVSGATFNLTTAGSDKFNSLAQGVSDSFVFNFGVSDGTVVTPGTWTVQVNGQNDRPLQNGPLTLSINENNAAGAVVGTVTANDPDIGDSKYFEFTNGTQISDNGLFGIDRASGVVTALGSLNFEAASAYSIPVTVRDRPSDGLTDFANVTVNVVNVNEAPVFSDNNLGYTLGPVAENQAAGAPVGAVSASDPDGDARFYEFSNGSQTSGLFTIDRSSGAITTNAPLDFEATTTHYYDLNVVVRDRDGGGLTDSANVRVHVSDVPDLLFTEDFSDNSAGWTLGPEWQIGSAMSSSGQTTGYGDPAFDHTPTADNGVAGVVIGGNASTGLHGFYYLTSPIINTTGDAGGLSLSYWRWLNSDYTPYMQNTVDVWNGSSWVSIWQSGPSPEVTDNAWKNMTHDITAYSNANLQVRFGFNVGSSGVWTMSSWNLDDVIVT